MCIEIGLLFFIVCKEATMFLFMTMVVNFCSDEDEDADEGKDEERGCI